MEYESEGGGCREYEDEREVSVPGRMAEPLLRTTKKKKMSDYKECGKERTTEDKGRAGVGR